MNRDEITQFSSTLTDSEVSLVLERNGWERFGGQASIYSRWRPASNREARSIVLPENQELADYQELLTQAVAQILAEGDQHLRGMLERISALRSLGDEVRFHKEARTARGTIPWLAGEDLYSGARRSMIVAAKTRRSRLAYYGNANSHLARSFLDSVLMGQTDVGSYVVTAYVPPEEIFTDRKLAPGSTTPLTGNHTGRDITKGLLEVLETTREAVDHYNSTGSTHGFLESVNHGMCYEITQAVRDLVRNSDGAEVAVEMHIAADLFESPALDRRALDFSPADYPVLEKAGNVLAATARPQNVTVTGTVTLLNRPAHGSPGVIRLDVISGTSAKKMRVRLSAADYDLAVDAHRDNLALRVSGRQEIDGRYYWLYEPTLVELVEITRAEPTGDSPDIVLPFFGDEE